MNINNKSYKDIISNLNTKLDDNFLLDLDKSFKYNKLASFYFLKNDNEKSLELYLKALNNIPDNFIYINLYMNLGNNYSQLKQYDKAIIYYKMVINYFPLKNNNIIYNKNICNKIIEEKILNKDFNNIEAYDDAYNNLGFTYLQQGKAEEALNILQISLNTTKNKDLFINFTNSLRYLGKYNEAKQLTWNKIIEEVNFDFNPIIKDISDIKSKFKTNNINIICVKWGNKYGAEYVNKLKNGFDKYLTKKFNFICFTDNSKNINNEIIIENLNCKFQSWWTKSYIFNKKLSINKPGNLNFFIDLDVVITNEINTMLDSYNIKNFNLLSTEGIQCEGKSNKGYNSSIIIWNSSIDFSHIYDQLMLIYDVMKKYIFRFDYWLEMVVPNSFFIQNIFKNKVKDYLESCIDNVPDNCSIVIFPREPKPHNCKSNWVNKYWI